MYPEVQHYITTRDEAYESYVAARSATVAKRDAGDISYDEWSRLLDAAYAASRVSTNEAWNALKTASDPLVRFIAENCKDYQDEAQRVLKALPATLEELDALAGNENWCSIWNQFRDLAVETGLFGEVKPLSEAQKALNRWLDVHWGMSRASVAKVNELVSAIVAEATVSA